MIRNQRCNKLPKSGPVRGFTLLELMIVVAIVAILAAIALPAYRDYVTRGYLADGTNQLSAFRAQMEQYYQDARQYTTTGTFTSPCAALPAPPASKWTYSCTVTASAYTIKAVGSGPVLNFTYTIDEQNNQKTMNVPNASWGVANTAPQHWIMRKGG